jgi:hypothetical protein
MVFTKWGVSLNTRILLRTLTASTSTPQVLDKLLQLTPPIDTPIRKKSGRDGLENPKLNERTPGS